MEFFSQSPISSSDDNQDAVYINDGPHEGRCEYAFLVDEQLNWVDKSGSVRVFSARGKKCGLPRDPAGGDPYCFWHRTDPAKFSAMDYRRELEKLVNRRAYLAGAYLSAEGYATVHPAVDLSGANLHGARLAGAYMEGTLLNGANLKSANLQGAFLAFANLSNADLAGAHISGADFDSAEMGGIELYDAGIDNNTRFDGVVWAADYILSSELKGQFDRAESTYRALKQHRQERGDYHTAGEFYFREMECIRKRRPGFRRLLWTVFYKSTCGYGERPTWTFFWALAVIIFWGLIVYPIVGIHNPDGSITRLSSPAGFRVFMDGLSLSLITFATLGYGNRYPVGQTGELLAGCEALLGMLLSSIFVVTFAKRVVRG